MSRENGLEIFQWDEHKCEIAEWLGNEERGVIFMQFTGLKDKNGKEIYEGDIIKQIYHGWVEEVVWDSYGYFTFKDNTDIRNILGLVVPQYWQVIGNIYENPELLKKGV